MKALDLAVLEARWWGSSNSSVKPLFDTLADLHHDNPAGYHYEMFNTPDSFRACLERVAANRRYRHVYIGAHGNEKGIEGPDRPITRTMIGNTLNKISERNGTRLDGLHFGCCQVGNENTVNFLFQSAHAERTKLVWIAGYSKPVDWIDSSAVDLFFWNAYYSAPKAKAATEKKRIAHVAKRILAFMPGAHRELGLEIYVRERGKLIGLIAREEAQPSAKDN